MASQAGLRDIRDFARIWVNAGLSKKDLAPVLVAVTRMDEMLAEYEVTVSKADSFEALAADLAHGKLTVKEVAIALAERNMIRAEQVRGIITEAQAVCFHEAVAFITNDPETLANAGPGPRAWLQEFGYVAPPPPEPMSEEEERRLRMAMGPNPGYPPDIAFIPRG